MNRVKSKFPAIPESQVQATAISMLGWWGFVVHRRNTGAITPEYKGKKRFVRFSEPGASDLWCVTQAGIHWEIEIKRKGERPSLDQVRWLIRHNGIGGSVAFWIDDTGDLERIYRHIEAGGRIEYLGTQRWYRVKQGGTTVKVQGPSGDFVLV